MNIFNNPLLKLFWVIFIMCFTTVSDAQVHEEWARRYNGAAPGSGDQGHSLSVDPSGNVIVTGHIQLSATNTDFLTVKYNPGGDTLWKRTYDGPGADGDDFGFAVVTDNAGNAYVTGFGKGTGAGGVWDIATIKYSTDGDILWVKRYAGPVNFSSYGYSIALDASGNVYVAGATSDGLTDGQFVTVKYDQNGNELWARRYAGSGVGIDYGYCCAADLSGNVYVTGISVGDNQNQDFTTIKYSPSGDSLWVRRYNGTANENDYASWLAVDNSGNVFVAGSSEETGTGTDITVIKYSTDGTTGWIKKYNGSGNGYDGSYVIFADGAGNIYAGGNSTTSSGIDAIIVKYSNDGNLLWSKTFNGPGGGNDIIQGLIVNEKGDVYGTGSAAGDYLTIKYNSSGVEQWSQLYNGTGNGLDGTYSIVLDTNGGVFVTGYSEGPGTSYDYVTVKYSQTTGIKNISDVIPDNFILEQNYPNPFNPVTKIKFNVTRDVRREMQDVSLTVYNALGKKVTTLLDDKLSVGSYEIDFNGNNLPSGIYFYELKAGDFSKIKKMILLK